jgi:hypothetical protein
MKTIFEKIKKQGIIVHSKTRNDLRNGGYPNPGIDACMVSEQVYEKKKKYLGNNEIVVLNINDTQIEAILEVETTQCGKRLVYYFVEYKEGEGSMETIEIEEILALLHFEKKEERKQKKKVFTLIDNNGIAYYYHVPDEFEAVRRHENLNFGDAVTISNYYISYEYCNEKYYNYLFRIS